MKLKEDELRLQAEDLVGKTRHYLVTTMGRFLENATSAEIYRALSFAMREEVMCNWLATSKTMQKHNCRIIYYLSMEYLPGRIFSNAITNLQRHELFKEVLRRLGTTEGEILTQERDPGLGNGGLGRLAACFLDSLATLHYPAQGYGLRYQYGMFEQQMWGGVQEVGPDRWLFGEYPWEFRCDSRRVGVRYGGRIISEFQDGCEMYDLQNDERVWAFPFDIPIIGFTSDHDYSALTLRLWSTKESPRNFGLRFYHEGKLDLAAENTTLTDVLYPSDWHDLGKRLRLKQEFLLVSASLQDIIQHYRQTHHTFDEFADKVRIQINDTHPALAIVELIRMLTMTYRISWDESVEIANTCFSYTNHTVLQEAFEVWNRELLLTLLPRQYRIIERLNQECLNRVRIAFPNDEEKVRKLSIIEEGKVRMANLAIFGSHKVNGVAKLHTEILKTRLFHDFYSLSPDKFINVTNGVTQRKWLLHCNPELAALITEKIGDGWIKNFSLIGDLAKYAEDSDTLQRFLAIKRQNKVKLADYLHQYNPIRNAKGAPINHSPLADPDSLFSVQIKRIHEYKRQLMNALHLIMLYHDLLDNPDHNRIKRTAIIAGKAAPSYDTAINILRLIFCIARKVNSDERINPYLKIILVENYGVTIAEHIIPAADLSEQISTAGHEASGTGNMKLTMNGALTIGTEDGSNIEMREDIGDAYWPFSFGASADEITRMRSDGTYSPWAVSEKHPRIQRAVQSLCDHTFAVTSEEHFAISSLYHLLMEPHYGGQTDNYFVLYDLQSYYETQKKAEDFYKNPSEWARLCLHNIAGMARFSTDYSIKQYAEKIWGVLPCPLDPTLLEEIRTQYADHFA